MSHENEPARTPTPADAPRAPSVAAAPPTKRGAMVGPQYAAIWPNVLGIIGLVLGSLAALGGVWEAVSTLFFPFFMRLMPFAVNTAPAGLVEDWAPITIVIALIQTAVAAMLVTGSIALIRRKHWSRVLLLTWAACKIAVSIADGVSSFYFSSAMMASLNSSGTAPPVVTSLGFRFVLAVIQVGVFSIFPIVVLIWLNLGNVKRDVQRWLAGARTRTHSQADSASAKPKPTATDQG